MKYRSLFVMLFCTLSLAACGGDDSNEATNNTTNNSNADAHSQDAGDEDVATIGDVSQQEGFEHRCDDAPIEDWPLHEEVSTESISASTADGVTTYQVEAVAGGTGNDKDNPFIYLDLGAAAKVEVNDIDAFSNTDWDLAFRRFVIRSNGGDSGSAGVSVAKFSETTFADVTSAPTDDSAWADDVSYDEQCTPITDPIGTLTTAFNFLNPGKPSGSWYDYGNGLTPTDGEIYVVDVPEEEKTYKLEIESWADGVFTIHVAEL